MGIDGDEEGAEWREEGPKVTILAQAHVPLVSAHAHGATDPPTTCCWLTGKASSVVHEHRGFQNDHISPAATLQTIHAAKAKPADCSWMRNLIHISRDDHIPRADIKLD